LDDWGTLTGELIVEAASINAIWDDSNPIVWLVTARSGNIRGGLIATFVTRASIAAACPRVLIGLGRRHHTCKLVEASGAFALHLLHEEHLPWVWRFGLQTGWDADKLHDLAFDDGKTGSPIPRDAPAWLDCQVENQWDIGDRHVFLGEVVDAGHRRAGPVLTVSRLLQLAPADKLSIMNEQHRQDAAEDEAAIRAWREQIRQHGD
jgi:flavin reductase (DIM6/NTAB) family NADH-FMN oxidoreductase RutF